MWVIGVIGVGVVGISFGISHYLHRHKGKSVIKDHTVGKDAAILIVLIWLVLLFLMSGGIFSFNP